MNDVFYFISFLKMITSRKKKSKEMRAPTVTINEVQVLSNTTKVYVYYASLFLVFIAKYLLYY
jgi:hypothetical protein